MIWSNRNNPQPLILSRGKLVFSADISLKHAVARARMPFFNTALR
jgi:hypothetical protein